MSAALALRHVRVPAESLGRARELMLRIAAAAEVAADAMDAVVAPLLARARRHPVPRTAALIGAARAWRTQVPTTGRVSLDVSLGKRALRIEEVRFTVARYRAEGWADTEAGISIARVVLVVGEWCEFEFRSTAIANFSLHALARRIERGWDGSDAAALVEGAEPGGEFAVPVPDGRWAGHVAEVSVVRGRDLRRAAPSEGRRAGVLVVRTFLRGN